MNYIVKKRDGSIVDFQIEKISEAIIKAFRSLHLPYDDSIIELLALRVIADFKNKLRDNRIEVEDIQDSVENVLALSGYPQVAKAYILYRRQRANVRQIAHYGLLGSKRNTTIEKMRTYLVHQDIRGFWENELFEQKISDSLKKGVFSLSGIEDFRLYATTIDLLDHADQDDLQKAKMLIELSKEFQNLYILHSSDTIQDPRGFAYLMELADPMCTLYVDHESTSLSFHPILSSIKYPRTIGNEPIFTQKKIEVDLKSHACFYGSDEKEKDLLLQALQVRNEVIDQLLRMGFYPAIKKYGIDCLSYPSQIVWKSELECDHPSHILLQRIKEGKDDLFQALQTLQNEEGYDEKIFIAKGHISKEDLDAVDQLIQKIFDLFPTIDYFKLF